MFDLLGGSTVNSLITSSTIARQNVFPHGWIFSLFSGAIKRCRRRPAFQPTVNSYADVSRLLDLLRCQVNATITIAGPRAHADGDRYVEQVILNNAATGWRDQVFAGDTLRDALAAAHAFTEQSRPAQAKCNDAFYAKALEVDAASRIAQRVVAIRARQIDAGRTATSIQGYRPGDLISLARAMLFFNQIVRLPDGAASANSAARSSPFWWHKEAAYLSLSLVDEPGVLLEHVAAAVIAEIHQLETAGA